MKDLSNMVLKLFGYECNKVIKGRSRENNFIVKRSFVQILKLFATIGSAYVIWYILALLLKNESPVVVVLSESMSPSFKRGDILILKGNSFNYYAGKEVVFKVEDREIPIVHRIHISTYLNNSVNILTKGDNNNGYDQSLYLTGYDWIGQKNVTGEVLGYIPYIGYFSIIINDFPYLKYAILFIIPYFKTALEE